MAAARPGVLGSAPADRIGQRSGLGRVVLVGSRTGGAAAAGGRRILRPLAAARPVCRPRGVVRPDAGGDVHRFRREDDPRRHHRAGCPAGTGLLCPRARRCAARSSKRRASAVCRSRRCCLPRPVPGRRGWMPGRDWRSAWPAWPAGAWRSGPRRRPCGEAGSKASGISWPACSAGPAGSFIRCWPSLDPPGSRPSGIGAQTIGTRC